MKLYSNPVHFGNKPDSNATLAEIKKTIQNANQLEAYTAKDPSQWTQEHEARSLVVQANKAAETKKAEVKKGVLDSLKGWFTALVLGSSALLGATHYGYEYQGRQLASAQERAQKEESDAKAKGRYFSEYQFTGAIQNHKEGQKFFDTFRILSLLVLTGTLAGSGIALAAGLGQLKTLLDKSKKLQTVSLQLEKSWEPADQRLVLILKKKVDKAAEKYAERMAKAYDENPELKSLYNQVFGGKEQLPKSADILRLFEYMNYQHLMEERKDGKKNPLQKMSEEEHLTRVYILLKTGLKLGKIFEFAEAELPSQAKAATQSLNPPFAQKFNTSLNHSVILVDEQVRRQLEPLKALIRKELELEDYIQKAQLALAPLTLSEMDCEAEKAELLGMIQQLKDRKQNIGAELSREDDSLVISQSITHDLKSETQETMGYLKSLTTEDILESLIQAELDKSSPSQQRKYNS